MTENPDHQPLHMEEDLLREHLIEGILPALHRFSIEQLQQVDRYVEELALEEAQNG